jgi:ABC-type transport system substrate-binding protein
LEFNYWSSTLYRRTLSRRRLIAGLSASASGAVALSLIGCGRSSKSRGDGTGLIGNESDSTKTAKPGGILLDSYASEIANLDPLLNSATNAVPHLLPVYSNLLRAGLSATEKPGDDAISGDIAESWELTPDAMRITLKLRANQKFDPRPPTNGRVMDLSDVRWSWDKFVALSPNSADLVYARSSGTSPIDSLETPDAQTMVFKLAFPYGAIAELLASAQNFYVEPRDDTFNFKGDMRGSGPFFLDAYEPGSRINYKKNRDWHGQPMPFLDGIERALLPDYSTGLAQFKAKHIWTYDVRPEDVLAVKGENPAMTMLPVKEVASGAFFLNFSKRDDSVFKDVRVRRAISMLLDRDLLIDTEQNVTAFEAAGLLVKSYWHSHLAAGLPEWVDPKGTGLGDGARYFQHNPAEAKKLVEAAGFKTPLVAPYSYFTDRTPLEVERNEKMAAMMSEAGVFKMTLDGLIYDTSWRDARVSAGTGFAGILYHRASALQADLILTQKYTPDGRNAVSKTPLPIVTDLVKKQRTEIDSQKRLSIIHEIQKQLAQDWPDLSLPGDAPGFSLRWPWLRNHGIFLEGFGVGSARSFTLYWYDQSKQNA